MKKLLIFLVLFAILFVSSGQTYEEQSIIPLLEKVLPSKPMEGVLSRLPLSPYWEEFIADHESGYYYFLEFLLRKAAHFVLFGAIGLTIFLLLKRSKPFTAFSLTVCIAMFDEYRQSFTGGRTPAVQDVFLDASGAAVAILLWIVYRRIRQSRHSQPDSNKNRPVKMPLN